VVRENERLMDVVSGAWKGRLRPGWTVTVTESDPAAAASPARRALDDDALVAAAAAGDRTAFDTLVERHQRTVYQLCYRFVGRHEEALDLAQDVFLRAYRGLHRFRGASSFRTWIYRIGINACLNRVSGRAPVAEPLDDHRTLRDPGQDPASRLLSQERAERVRAAVARLPPRQRATLVLRVYQELSHEEIATVLGGSVGSAKANFFHALRNLRKLLEGEQG
jgi:RNA polymerase sigma-70 factor (ECF subfamily)